LLYVVYSTNDEQMTVIPIRLTKKDARKLDLLVKLGIYENRSEAIRGILHAEADTRIANYMLNERVLRALDQLLEYDRRRAKSPIYIQTKKTAAELVAEGRK